MAEPIGGEKQILMVSYENLLTLKYFSWKYWVYEHEPEQEQK